jgi:uncharacterized protein (TIGR02391 family)
MFPKLLEILPNAESLLSLEPKELAAHLLESLEGSQQINPESVISHSYLSRSLQTKTELRQKYPPKHDDEILFALREAWQWLEREGFVAPRPTDLSRERSLGMVTTYFVTRRGQKIETPENLVAYRKADPLPKLHPIIAQKVSSLFSQGDYDIAVFQGFKEVEIAVRKTGGYAETDYGTDLMRKAFHHKTGKLTDPNQQQAERQARSDLFAGAIGSYKNPGSHRNVNVTAEEAVEIIILASHLLQIVDSCI